MYLESVSDLRQAYSFRPQAENLVEIVFDDGFLHATALRASQDDTRGLPVRKGFLRALGDEVALDLRREREGESYYLGIDVVAEVEIVLNGVDADLFLRAGIQYGHDHQHIPTEPGNLRADKLIPFLHPFQGPAKLAFLDRDRPRNGLPYPAVDPYSLLFRPFVDLEFLARTRLGFRADPNIRVSLHNLTVWPHKNTLI